MTEQTRFIAQVRRDSQWETIVHADKNRTDLLGQPVLFFTREQALQAGQHAWGPIQASEELDYRALPAP